MLVFCGRVEEEEAGQVPVAYVVRRAAAVTAEPAAKMIMETRRTSWRPKMSASLPLRGRTAVQARLYADETHTKESVPLRSWMIDGSAVDTEACEQ